MSRPIQTLAPGFLSMLGLKNEGRLPADMVDMVQPVVDLRDFYFSGNREVVPELVATNVLVAAVNYVFVDLSVPQNEIWWVHGYAADVPVPAAQSWTGQAIHYDRNTRAIHVGNPITIGGAGATNGRPFVPGGFFAQGGDLFGVLTTASAGAGAINAFATITISRFLA